MPAKPIPEGFHTVTPYLMVRDAQETIDFLKKAFGATESHPPMRGPDGKIMHAEMKIGDLHVMLGEGNDAVARLARRALYLYVADADAVLQAGGRRGRQVDRRSRWTSSTATVPAA